MHHTALIEDLAIILCIAGIVTVLFQKIKQPTILGYLIAGIIIGPYTPPFSFIDDEAEIRILAELGVIFLMFSIGLEFSFRKLTRIGGAAIIIGIFEVLVMTVIGFLTGRLIGWSIYESMLLGAALSISSTTIIIKALEDLNLKKYDFSELMIGVLLVEDLMAILLMVFVSTTISDETFSSQYFVWTTVKLLTVIASWFLIGYFAIPYLMKKIQNYINHETLTIIATGLCLFLSCVAIYFNYSAALGAFIMGSIMAESPQVKRIEMLTLPIRDIFAAVFFVSVGMLINPWVIIEFFPQIILLSIVTILGKIISSSIGGLIAGQSLSTSLRIGFGMAQIGEFSFIIIGLGGSMTLISPSLYPIVVAIAAITTFATPYLIKFSLRFSKQIEQKIPSKFSQLIYNYRQWINAFQPLGPDQGLQTKDIARFMINGIIVAIICVIPSNFLIPKFFPSANTTWILELIIWSSALSIASPFIWAMLFAQTVKEKFHFTVLRIFGWIITFAELLFLILPFLSFHSIILPIALILTALIKFNFFRIKDIYFSLENRLVDNLTQRKESEEDELFQKFAPWDYDLIRFKVTHRFPLIGQTLESCRFRSSFGIYILAIKRDEETIWIPNAKEEIQINDELVVLGNKEEIEQFRDFTEKMESIS